MEDCQVKKEGDFHIKQETLELKYEDIVADAFECEPDIVEQNLGQYNKNERRKSGNEHVWIESGVFGEINPDKQELLMDFFRGSNLSATSELDMSGHNSSTESYLIDDTTDNPWPYIEEFFSFVGDKIDKTRQSVSVIFRCNLCLPKNKTISANRRSLYNLKSHMGNIHPGELKQFELCIREKSRDMRKRKCEDIYYEDFCSNKQNVLSDGFIHKRRKARHERLIKLVSNLVVEEMLPLRIVESDAFTNLITAMQSTRLQIERKDVADVIDKKYEEHLDGLKSRLAPVDSLAATVDCWSCYNKSYLGVSVHWIDEETLARKSAILACRHIKAQLTYNSVAKELEAVFDDYQIKNKICKISTDDGSNFAHTFKLFSLESETTQLKSHSSSESPSSLQHCLDSEEESEGDLSFENLCDILDCEHETDSAVNGVYIPEHFQCAAYTLNLVATVDCEKALSNSTFKEVSQSAVSKAQTLWKKQSQDTESADLIKQELGELFTIPCSTQWKSMYSFLLQIHMNLTRKEKAMIKTLDSLGISPFSTLEAKFIEEYTTVMRPLARALEVLQSDTTVYMGFLLPTLTVCKAKLKGIENKCLQICSPLVSALYSGIETRFEASFKNGDFILSSAFHPSFKLDWISSSVEKETVKQMMTKKLLEKIGLSNEKTVPVAVDDDDDDYFSCLKSLQTESDPVTQRSSEQIVVFLSKSIANRNHISSSNFPSEEFKTIFIQLNTPVPSIAAVDTIFTAVKDSVRSKRACLVDYRPNFEKYLLLKLNKTA